MKKILSILVLAVMVALPMSAKAVEGTISGSCDPSKRCDNGKCVTTCKIAADKAFKDANVTSLDMTLTFNQSGVTIKEINGANNWIATRNGEKINLISGGWPTNPSNYNLLTLTLEMDSSVTDCGFKIVAEGLTVEIPDPGENPPETGSVLPIAIVATGIGAAGVIYFATKKSKKLYKI